MIICGHVRVVCFIFCTVAGGGGSFAVVLHIVFRGCCFGSLCFISVVNTDMLVYVYCVVVSVSKVLRAVIWSRV